MACECFEDGRMTRCGAVAGTLIPSHHERERYCRTDESAECPTLQLYRLRGAPLSQEAYYALWMPAPEPLRAPLLAPRSVRRATG